MAGHRQGSLAARLPAPGRGRRERRVYARWSAAWLAGPVIGVANGATREWAYQERVDELTAHQISTATGIALFGLYFWWLQRRWPIPTAGLAWRIGGTWVVLTVVFEFGFGHWVAGRPWSVLLADYDVTQGRVWALVPAWLAAGPALVRRLDRG